MHVRTLFTYVRTYVCTKVRVYRACIWRNVCVHHITCVIPYVSTSTACPSRAVQSSSVSYKLIYCTVGIQCKHNDCAYLCTVSYRTCARMVRTHFTYERACTYITAWHRTYVWYESACTYVIQLRTCTFAFMYATARTYAFTFTYVRMSVSQYVPQAPFTYSICVCTRLACNDQADSVCTYVLWQRMYRTHLRNERACARIIRMHRMCIASAYILYITSVRQSHVRMYVFTFTQVHIYVCS
jgi:hypothetical protein